MTEANKQFNARRRWLIRSSATVASAFGMGSVGNLLLGARPAYAADYKALVCVFLYGGNDGMNMLVPADATRYAAYAGVRGGLAIPRARLIGLDGQTGLHPAMSALSTAWNAGSLAPIFNVGPLRQPLTKTQYRAAIAGTVPDSLFSHSDQQTLWETGTASATERTGWGGRASAALGTANPVISVAGTPRFGSSALQSALVLPGPGQLFGAYDIQGAQMAAGGNSAKRTAINTMYSQAQDTVLANAYAAAQRDAFTVSDRLSALVAVQPGDAGASSGINAGFAPLIAGGQVTTPFGQQMYQIAKLIESNATVQGNRQIFFASMGGFDTHAGQTSAANATDGVHANLLKQLADGLAAFTAAMKNVGLGQAVTAFTQSDFGRTFVPNSSNGTDHAWGNQHLVIGGAVRGGRSYGTYPELTLGGKDDVGVNAWELQGRWIPTTSVDQYAATLLSWFGATDAQIDSTLPNWKNYSSDRKLGFV